MTLHDAIQKLLIQVGRPMTTSEIADALNKDKWYVKKDHSKIDPFQIHGRTKNYPHMFLQDGSTISLVAWVSGKQSSIVKNSRLKQAAKTHPASRGFLSLNPEQFRCL